MQMREDLQLETAIRALAEVVLPAVDADNALAIEQLQVVIGTLQLLAARLPLRFRYDCDELARLVELGRTLGVDDAALSAATSTGADVLSRAQAGPAQVLAAVRALRVASGAHVSRVYRDGDAARRDHVTRVVLEHAEQQLLRERAWVAPQGWEIAPAQLPAIEDLL